MWVLIGKIPAPSDHESDDPSLNQRDPKIWLDELDFVSNICKKKLREDEMNTDSKNLDELDVGEKDEDDDILLPPNSLTNVSVEEALKFFSS